ncbi:MAG: ABC transporter substrate-binding protein [Bacteroidota bacterium]
MRILLYLFCFVIFVSCKNENFKSKDLKFSFLNKYAKNIRFIKRPTYTEVQILNPDKNSIEKKYALAKDISNLKIKIDVIPIQIPLKSIIALSGTDIGMLQKISCADKITGILNIDYINNSTIKRNFSKNKVKEVQDLGQINPESLLGVSSTITYSGFGNPPSNEEKLAKIGILCIPNYDWKEIHPMGKAEWIKFYGLLFDKEEQANTYFSKIEKEYLKLIKLAKKIKEKPSLISGSMIGDSWYMPAGESFNAELFEKASSNYVSKNSKGTGSTAYSFENVLKDFQHTEFWINPGFKSKKELLQANSKYQFFDAFKEDKIYCYSHDMNHFWEMSAIEPQKVLSDLIQILHPNLNPKKKLYFYKRIN